MKEKLKLILLSIWIFAFDLIIIYSNIYFIKHFAWYWTALLDLICIPILFVFNKAIIDEISYKIKNKK